MPDVRNSKVFWVPISRFQPGDFYGKDLEPQVRRLRTMAECLCKRKGKIFLNGTLRNVVAACYDGDTVSLPLRYVWATFALPSQDD
jgi:hypothetical protein